MLQKVSDYLQQTLVDFHQLCCEISFAIDNDITSEVKYILKTQRDGSGLDEDLDQWVFYPLLFF